MNIHEEEEIKKEFQLERVILFSDAVFAIIITIMVLEIKLPEGLRHASPDKIKEAFLELVPKLGSYIAAFFITGVFWSRHLKIFSYLKDYDRGIIILNLLFLFFVSLFPFGVSLMTGTLSPKNIYFSLLPYMVILMMALFTQTLLIGYLIRKRLTLCFNPGLIAEKFKWKVQRLNFITLPLLITYVIIAGINHLNPQWISYGFMLWFISMVILRKRLYPNSVSDEPMIKRIFSSRKSLATKNAE